MTVRGELARVSEQAPELAARLSAAEDFADQVTAHLRPPNTERVRSAGWRVWERFCAEQGFPTETVHRGVLTVYAAWLLRCGCQDGTGYARAAADANLSSAVVGLRARGCEVSRSTAAAARHVLDGLALEIERTGERRGRGKAPAVEVPALLAVSEACPDTLAGARDRALILLGFHIGARASELSGLLAVDVEAHRRGLLVHVLTAKTEASLRTARVLPATDPLLCPVAAWRTWRSLLASYAHEHQGDDEPAFHRIDRWGHIQPGRLSPQAVTSIVTRAADRAGVELHLTGHSLRAGFATTAHDRGHDLLAIAQQGGWAPGSRALLGYIRLGGTWGDSASAGLTD